MMLTRAVRRSTVPLRTFSAKPYEFNKEERAEALASLTTRGWAQVNMPARIGGHLQTISVMKSLEVRWHLIAS
jgi:hypothetical protein